MRRRIYRKYLEKLWSFFPVGNFLGLLHSRTPWLFLGSCLYLTMGALTGERRSRVTQENGMVTLCTLRTATVLSRNCCADFGCPLTMKIMSRSRDGPGVTTPLPKKSVPLTGVWNPPVPHKTLLGPETLARYTKILRDRRGN